MEIATKLAPICLAIIMFGLGLGLTTRDFLRVIKTPRDFIVGFLSQVILLPIIAFGLILIIPMPIEIAYKTPETLGKDRIAAVIGARFLYPKGPVLAIDAGTCITYDILTEDDVYLGGNISPGAHLRFRAMDEFTHALPLVEQMEVEQLYGQSTEESMATGVITGIAAEMDGMIERYEEEFSGVQTVICGGDARYFVNMLKKKIFANRNLVLLGLHKILLFNESKRS